MYAGHVNMAAPKHWQLAVHAKVETWQHCLINYCSCLKLVDVLVIRVEYVLLGDPQIRELMLPRHSLTALVMHGAAVHSMYCLMVAFIPAVNTTKISGPYCCYNVGAELYVVVCP